MGKAIAASRRPQAERAGEWALRECFGCVETRRAVKTQWQRQDFFAADIIGIRADGSKVWCQVTAGQDEAVRQRRRKLEAIPWHKTDTVCILQLVERQSVVSARRKDWFFRVHRMSVQDVRCANTLDTRWEVAEVIVVKPEWFKAMRSALLPSELFE